MLGQINAEIEVKLLLLPAYLGKVGRPQQTIFELFCVNANKNGPSKI